MKRALTTLLLILSLTAQAETGRIYITLTAAVKLQETKPISFGSLITFGGMVSWGLDTDNLSTE